MFSNRPITLSRFSPNINVNEQKATFDDRAKSEFEQGRSHDLS